MIKVIIKIGLNRNNKEKEGKERPESGRYLKRDILLFINARNLNLI